MLFLEWLTTINRYGPISVELVYKNEPIVEKKKKGNGRKRKTLG